MAEAVVACHTTDASIEELELGRVPKIFKVIFFTAPWCVPCRAIPPFFAELAKRFTNVEFSTVDVADFLQPKAEYGIMVLPTFIFLKEGTVIDKVVGANVDELLKKIKMHGGKEALTRWVLAFEENQAS